MGVHDLWSIVEPVRESVPLYSLVGKTLAVDLSLWVCEAQHVQAMMGRVTKPHLRNLFFRVSSLTLMGVKLVFVVEGEAPKLKAETMSKRTQTRFGGFKKTTTTTKCATNTSRGRFRAVLRECTEMLDYLGVPWVAAAGEAEAMCAFLDSQGLVDGCITNDGDAFLYGAQTVYRNFNVNSKDPQVDCYQTSRIQSQLHLCRENLVGLAILLGCDYIPKGIPGVGKEQALKILQTLKGQTLLQKFDQWKDNNASVSEGLVKKVPHCHICRHPGSAKTHERGGCLLCDSKHFCQPQDFDYKCPCDWHRYENSRQASSLEANIRKKTLASQLFPFTEIIKEFLMAKDKPVSHFRRRRPNMQLMQKFAHDRMEWPKHYTSEKVLVLMTYMELMNRKHGRDSSSQIKPLRIVKPRVRNAVACFEVMWSTPEHYVFPDDHPAENQREVRTVEEESLFCVAFPDVVDRYLRDKALDKTKKKKTKSKTEKAPDVSDGVSDLFAQMTLDSAPANAPPRPHAVLPSVSNTAKVEAWHREEERSRLDVCRAESKLVASPSSTAAVDALHLSDIDWDALSFTSSPSPHSATGHATGSKLLQIEDGDIKEAETSSCAVELCYTNCSLRERVLMKNGHKATNQVKGNDAVDPKQQKYKLPSLQRLPARDSDLKIPREDPHDRKSTGKKSNVKKTEPNAYKRHRVASNTNMKTKTSAERSSSDPGQCGRAKTEKSTKKSVCMSVCSSSDDSDTENRRPGPRGKAETNRPARARSGKPCADVEGSGTSVASQSRRPDASPAPVIVLDSEDSVICSDCESPLPLAERLRRRFQK